MAALNVTTRQSPPYLRITGDPFTGYHDALRDKPLDWLGPLARINVFVGATNAGKSRFMRALIRNEHQALIPQQATDAVRTITTLWETWQHTDQHLSLQFMGSGWRANDDESGSDYQRAILDLARPGKGPGAFVFDRDMLRRIDRAFHTTLTTAAADSATKDAYSVLERHRFWLQERLGNRSGISEEFYAALRALGEALAIWLAVAPIEVVRPPQIYIPTLRSAVRLFRPDGGARIDEDILEATFRVNYGWGLGPPGQQPEVFTGNRLAWAVQQERGGSRDDREQLRQFECFLSEEFFGHKPIELVPRAETKDEHQRLAIGIGDQADRLIHEVGDGIQAIIILMYRLFTAAPGSWIFIEEPEINLHPGLQRIFLHALAHNEAIAAKDLRIFLTTHSNHLLGTLLPETSDVAIFSFQEADTPGCFLVRPVLARDHNPMTLLGVSNASVLLANCSIWVEGSTDRTYLRAYLKAYQESGDFQNAVEKGTRRLLREDIHYAFLEYAGSNLSHYLFDDGAGEVEETPEKIRALALCNRIFLLADRDEGKEGKHERLRAATAESSGNLVYCTTDGIEIENMIPEKVLQLALPKLIQRGDQAAIATIAVREADYRETPLGQYLRERLGAACPGTLVAQGGTLASYYKDKLARSVAELVPVAVRWEELSPPIQRLTEDLYAFIARHNP